MLCFIVFVVSKQTRSSLNWSARLRLALDAARLLDLLEQRSLIHCDWKADQVAITRDLRLKLVDFKSLRYHGASRWLASQQCVVDADCHSVCFKWLAENDYDAPDAACDALTGLCHGLDATSMAHASAQLLFYPLLAQHLPDEPPAGFDDAVRLMLTGLSAPRVERWTAARAADHIGAMQQRFGAHSHYAQTRAASEALVLDIGQQFWKTAEQRCGNSRFC